ncbi:MAG TPA: hypothetical protein VF885_22555, partial [Arthrobacter sp.]
MKVMNTMSRISSRCGAIVAAVLVSVGGCSRPVADPADSIYINANVITMNDAQPRAEALAFKGGKVLVVGTRKDVEARKGSATKVIDLAG